LNLDVGITGYGKVDGVFSKDKFFCWWSFSKAIGFPGLSE